MAPHSDAVQGMIHTGGNKGWQQELLKPALLLKPSNCKTAAYEKLVSLRSSPTRQKEMTWQRTFFLMSFSNKPAMPHTGSCNIHYSVYHKTSLSVNEHSFSSYAPEAFWDLYVYCQLHTAMGNRKKTNIYTTKLSPPNSLLK